MYGVYSATYSIFLLISTIQTAIIAEPMSIYGVEKYKNIIVYYLNYLLRMQWFGSFILTFLLILISLFIRDRSISENLLMMALTMPFILFFWYLRRAFYLEAKSGLAMTGSIIYFLTLLALIFILRSTNHFSSIMAYLTMAISSLFASIFTIKWLGVKFFGDNPRTPDLKTDIVRIELWDMGKWLMFAYLASWFTTLSYPFLITVYINPQFAGIFRSIQNIFLPFQQLLAALTLLLLPWLSKQKEKMGDRYLFIVTRRIAFGVSLGATFYCIFIVLFRDEIMKFLYANDLYTSSSGLLLYAAAVTIIGAIHLIFGLALRVIRKTNIILWSKGVSALFGLLVGIPVIWRYQINGVLFLFITTAVIEAFILIISYIRIERKIIFNKNRLENIL
jgi:O-antigen/teichoic acid export membrane protein